MKKLGVVLMLLATVMTGFAQDKTADAYKNEGNEFVRNKQFQQALESYQKAISLWEADKVDAKTVYNAADCARRIKDNKTAMELFTKSIEMGQKPDMATYYIATIYKAENNDEAYLQTLTKGYETYTEGKSAALFKKDLGKYYRDAANNKYKEGAAILQEAQKAKPEQYNEITARAKAKFEEAKPLVEKAISINAEDQNAQAILELINKQL